MIRTVGHQDSSLRGMFKVIGPTQHFKTVSRNIRASVHENKGCSGYGQSIHRMTDFPSVEQIQGGNKVGLSKNQQHH